jgi:phage recombination protein Bet
MDPAGFAFINVEKEPTPGGVHRVSVTHLPEHAIDLGRRLMGEACQRWLALGKAHRPAQLRRRVHHRRPAAMGLQRRPDHRGDRSMTSTAVERHTGTGLALTGDQAWWTKRQEAGLAQLGLAKADPGDLLVFMHVAQRTGLDPFAKQIYMIGRNGRELIDGQWTNVVKQTIQTGIDGFRLVARRSADRLGETLEYEDTEWCGNDGVWADVWTHSTAPAAARVTVVRNGRRFPGVALYREYVQTKANGDPNAMWSKMPANQLAKCAEALALRKAYPQDLSGLYTDDEMGQADRAPRGQQSDGQTSRDRIAAALHHEQGGAQEEESVGGSSSTEPPEDVVDGELVDEPDEQTPDPADEHPATESPLLDLRSALARKLFAVLGQAQIADDRQHDFLSKSLQRPITSRKDLTEADAHTVIDALEAAMADTDLPDEGGQS